MCGFVFVLSTRQAAIVVFALIFPGLGIGGAGCAGAVLITGLFVFLDNSGIGSLEKIGFMGFSLFEIVDVVSDPVLFIMTYLSEGAELLSDWQVTFRTLVHCFFHPYMILHN